MRSGIILLILTSVVATAGCATAYQKRGVERPVPWERAVSLDEFEGNAVGTDSVHLRKLNLRLDAESRSIERYRDKETGATFTVGIIEINDDASFNPAQYEQVFADIDCELSLAPGGRQHLARGADCDNTNEKPSSGTLVVAFVHGWHHGCTTCDRDLACFRYVLNKLSRAEKLANTGRRVVGLYVGWRGRSLRGKLDVASIWARKATAQRLGRIAGRELLSDLDDRWNTYPKVTLVTAGHSLGGAFLLSAARGRLTGNTSEILDSEQHTYRTVRAQGERVQANGTKALRARFGDLMVLLNPAIEADDWRAFDRDLRDLELQRRLQADPASDLTPALLEELKKEELPVDKLQPYESRQLPVMIAIASKNDSAVRRIFPVSRWMAGLNPVRNPKVFFSSAQRTGVGHYSDHVTHTLDHRGPQREAEPEYEPKNCQCPPAWTREVKGAEVELALLSAPDDPRELFIHSDKELDPEDKRSWVLRQTPERACTDPDESDVYCRGWDPNSPYIVVQTDGRVIASHSDVFNPVVVGFLAQYLGSYKKYKSGREDVKQGF